MAREFGPEGIRVNSITPGLIGTDIIKGKLTEDKKAEIAETIPLGRLGHARDIALLRTLRDSPGADDGPR